MTIRLQGVWSAVLSAAAATVPRSERKLVWGYSRWAGGSHSCYFSTHWFLHVLRPLPTGLWLPVFTVLLTHSKIHGTSCSWMEGSHPLAKAWEWYRQWVGDLKLEKYFFLALIVLCHYEESGNFFLVIVNIAKPFFSFFLTACILIAHRFFISILRYFI